MCIWIDGIGGRFARAPWGWGQHLFLFESLLWAKVLQVLCNRSVVRFLKSSVRSGAGLEL